jgi:hypothetical protein
VRENSKNYLFEETTKKNANESLRTLRGHVSLKLGLGAPKVRRIIRVKHHALFGLPFESDQTIKVTTTPADSKRFDHKFQ